MPGTTSPPDDRARGPLAGVRVLDLSAYIAGPHACALLADLGSEVIKVEPPSGDALRHFPSSIAAESRAFLGINRSKSGIVLDLKTGEGRDVLLRLVESVDVLVHNFRPGVAARLGIEYDSLSAHHPRLIYCSLTGYGESGPLRDRAGYDQVLQGLTGISAIQGSPGPPQIVYGSVVDYYAGSLIVSGVTAALYHRERTGRGQHVGISLLASALCMQAGRFVWADGEPREADRDLRSGGITGIHPTAKGELYLSANAPHFWEALCESIGLPQLARDPDYDTIRKRAERETELVPLLRSALSRRTAVEWEDVFGDRVPCCAIRQIGEMFDHPQVLAQDLVATVQHAAVGPYRCFTRPIAFSETPCEEVFAAPALGEQTVEVLLRAGYSLEEVERLRASGAIRC